MCFFFFGEWTQKQPKNPTRFENSLEIERNERTRIKIKKYGNNNNELNSNNNGIIYYTYIQAQGQAPYIGAPIIIDFGFALYCYRRKRKHWQIENEPRVKYDKWEKKMK